MRISIVLSVRSGQGQFYLEDLRTGSASEFRENGKKKAKKRSAKCERNVKNSENLKIWN